VDRSYVAEILKKAVDEGRLTLSEYDERLQRTYQARTYGDLDKVILDLPRPSRRAAVQQYRAGQPVSGPGWTPQPPQRQPKETDWVRGLWMAWTIAVSVNVMVWLLVCVTAADFIYPWPVWVAGPWGAVLLVTTLMNRPKRQD
jgi:hypothetical protein